MEWRPAGWSVCLGTCEWFFCVRIESRIESAVRFDFESNFRIESAVYTTQAVTPSNELHRYLFCICHEREWCTQLSTCYSFQFSPKTSQTMPLYDYLTPKLDFKRKFNHRQSFLYKGRLTVRTIDGADDSKILIRIITTNRIPNRKFDSKSNWISKLRRSLSVSASVNLRLHHKVQKFSSGTGSPGWSRKKGRKTVTVCVLV